MEINAWVRYQDQLGSANAINLEVVIFTARALSADGYLRFTLSYGDVEELLAERGLDVSYETVRSWVLKFGPIIARRLRRSRPRPSNRWHLDEMVVRIAGKHMYLWRAVETRLVRPVGPAPLHVETRAGPTVRISFPQRGVRCELDLGEGGFANEIAAASPGGFTCLTLGASNARRK
jgi:hypothetical protein